MKNKKKVLLSVVGSMLLVTAMAFSTTGCKSNNSSTQTTAANNTQGTTAQVTTTAKVNENADVKKVGEGQTKFMFDVVDKDGKTQRFEINTNKGTVGEALLELKLIDGEESQYGLYVKSVNGISADFNKDGVFWAFYVNGEMSQKGVDSTPVKDGDTYMFKVQK